MSHGACRPGGGFGARGETIDNPSDIERIAAKVAYDSMDLLQAPHTWSGIEMAIWDLLGKACSEPVYCLLGYAQASRKLAYASQLFGKTPEETLEVGRQARKRGFRAAKFGWGPFGRGTLSQDNDHLDAAREGIGSEGVLLVDAGQIFLRQCRGGSGALACAGTQPGHMV